jgi:hypothetical protein
MGQLLETYRLFNCARCHVQVRICTRCDRGQCYCTSECSKEAYRQQVLEAGARYQATEKGRLNHKVRQQRYLERQEKTMTHKGPPWEADDLPLRPCPEAEYWAVSPGREEVNDADEIEESSPSQEMPSPVVSRSSDLVRCDFCGRLCGEFARLAPIRRRGRATSRGDVGRREYSNQGP